MRCLVNGGLKLSFYGGLKMLFYVGLEFVVLWRYKNAVLWRFQNGVSINKPQQDLDLTMTYTFHTYINDYFYSYK